MKYLRLAAVATLLAFGLAGCGGSDSSDSSVSSAPVMSNDDTENAVEWDQIDDNEWIGRWHLKNGTLICVFTQFDSDTLSCNWADYNRRANS